MNTPVPSSPPSSSGVLQLPVTSQQQSGSALFGASQGYYQGAKVEKTIPVRSISSSGQEVPEASLSRSYSVTATPVLGPRMELKVVVENDKVIVNRVSKKGFETDVPFVEEVCKVDIGSSNEKPAPSVANLIGMALCSQAEYKAGKNEIVRWITETFPYFKDAERKKRLTARVGVVLTTSREFERTDPNYYSSWQLIDKVTFFDQVLTLQAGTMVRKRSGQNVSLGSKKSKWLDTDIHAQR